MSIATGSPPQVRGKQIYDRLITMEDRITPAGAGKTRRKTMLAPSPKDHPRRCGENGKKEYLFAFGRGSPPQVRGKPAFLWAICSKVRITPAGAGKTPVRLLSPWAAQDHPRRCGENFEFALPALRSGGSPPQVRGKQLLEIDNGYAGRITPAGAGKTPAMSNS